MTRVGHFTVTGVLLGGLLVAVVSLSRSRSQISRRLAPCDPLRHFAAASSRWGRSAQQHSSSAADAAAQLIEQISSWDTAQCCYSAFELFVQFGHGRRWQPIA